MTDVKPECRADFFFNSISKWNLNIFLRVISTNSNAINFYNKLGLVITNKVLNEDDETSMIEMSFLEPEIKKKREFSPFTFSGHTGFHIHVRDPSLMGLDSNARREIVSYIRGEGLEVNTILSGGSSGWRDRIEIGTQSVLDKLKVIGEKSTDSKQYLDEFYGLLNPNTNHSRTRGVSKNRIR